MAKGDTKTNQYLDIAANGTRADLPSDTCCETRSQTLIREVAERIMDVEDEVEELKNNPDVVDIVDTYADLQAYGTSGLTDKDIIRVIADETKGGLSSYYRWNSPNSGWNFVGVIPDSGIKELSSADYNYPTANPDRVALWLLDNGVYTAPAGVMVAASTTSYPWYNTSDKTILVGGSDTVKGIYTFLNGKTDVVTTQVSDGTEADEYTLLKSNQVLQATGQSTTDTMSQKAVTDAIAAIPTGGITELTTADYNWNSTTGSATEPYDCVAMWLLPTGIYINPSGVSVLQSASSSVSTFKYTWVVSGDNNSYMQMLVIPPNASSSIMMISKSSGTVNSSVLLEAPAQTTGTSTTSVMSQKAVTDAIAAIPTGGVTELTSADYNYPTNNPTAVALWMLEPGTYSAENGLNVYLDSGLSRTVGAAIFIVGEKVVSSGNESVEIISFIKNSGEDVWTNRTEYVSASDGTFVSGTNLGGPTVVQSTGTSIANVMSQNAVTSMVYADPSTRRKIQIGYNTNATGAGSVTLGEQARATAQASVAFAYGAATTQGEFNIGTGDSWSTGGYNNSQYRLLTGLYDGQAPHDAANKGQLDKAIINGGTTAPTTATVGAVGTLYSYVDTTGTPTPHMMVCTVADTVTPSYTWQTLV